MLVRTSTASVLGMCVVVLIVMGAFPTVKVHLRVEKMALMGYHHGWSSWLDAGFGGGVGGVEARRKKKAPLTPAQEEEEKRKLEKRAQKAKKRAQAAKKKKKAPTFDELPREQKRYAPAAPSGAWDLLEQETILGDDDISWRWSKRSFEACEYVLREAGLLVDGPVNRGKKSRVPSEGSWVPKGYCHDFQDIVEDVFDIEGHNMADVVGHWDLNKILEHGEEEAFKAVGYQVVLDVLNWMKDGRVKRWDDIRQAFQSKWIGWMLKIVTGDKQNLYNLPPGFDPIEAREAKLREEWDPTYDAEAASKEREEKMMKGEHGF